MKEWIKEGRVFFGQDGKGAPQLKRYANEVKQGIVPTTIWSYDEFGHTDESRKELKDIFSESDTPFATPKPTRLLKRLLQIVSTEKDFIVLDSFAGSGTTAHAVLDLNKEDGGNRKFILVEMEDYANDITAERVRRVIKWRSNIQKL
jgi:adenine-specific DNA-methyltransferase